ncbi:hypothetical protein C1646_805766 [Rhizophagus diaphanus]|nr:hypothetical protein C1646_805766 [Rhizophagus diaphanus] [Rhizophagus sp. MUCL 43196]
MVRAIIRLTREMEEIFLKGGSNIASFRKNNKFSVPTQTTSNGEKFVDALSSPLSTIPRSKEEHEELDELNNKFSERLENIENKAVDTKDKGTTSTEKDKFNENKKRVVATQGRREDFDSE